MKRNIWTFLFILALLALVCSVLGQSPGQRLEKQTVIWYPLDKAGPDTLTFYILIKSDTLIVTK